ncbi:HmuY family protein [Reichenbachiella sp. MSK19-1]|uniref:HmuY family protein n=1 Tax=Reichenbachiella sp. MSK19-1 TaxID=1897631 RepID=UPI000E6C754D|nr:HmuY family protein [Reichenbachiella sp. MSK19-1]RJE71741.1 hypothetical protein BGP76_06540 [Reichenbachiella sp. MSK19-1]
MKHYINKLTGLLLLTIVVGFSACDENEVERIFEASFQTSTVGLAQLDETAILQVNFSIPTVTETTVTIDLSENGVVYGTDYSTSPTATDGVVTVTVPAGSESASFSITRLVEFIASGNDLTATLAAIDGEESPEFVGTTTVSVLFEEVIAQGGTIDLLTGGSNMPNQCYIDLSNFAQTAVRRDQWELAFYSGAENRVFLNAALLVTAVEISEHNDLAIVSSETVFDTPLQLSSFGQPVTVSNVEELLGGLELGYSMYGPYTDIKEGTLEGTAISEISATDEDNKVYIVSLGSEIPEEHNLEGGLTTTGDHRGFYKIRVLLDGDQYKLQYAPLDETNISEATFSKNTSANHTYFSIVDQKEVAVEPSASQWDINFSGVYSYYGFDFGFGAGLTYSDYALHNTLGGTALYQVTTYTTDSEGITTTHDVPSYDSFSLSDVDEASLISDNRAVIGSEWRDSSAGIAKDDRYFVIRDAENNYFKLKFTKLLSDEGERGHSQFVYELL